MKLVLISDTHSRHNRLEIPNGDMLIHAGDLSNRGYEWEIRAFLEWFSTQPHQYKIFIAGNHDFYFERESEDTIKNMLPNNVIYLNDSGVEIEGCKIWGSPVQPAFSNWAFNREIGASIKKHWDLIPMDTDILVTHGPPFQILDKVTKGKHVGCLDLMLQVNKIKPRLHIFGHIHEAYGVYSGASTVFVNASIVGEMPFENNKPVIIEL